MSFAQPMQLTAEGWRNLQVELSELEAKSQALPLESVEFSDDGDHIDLDREALSRRIDELRNLLAFAVPVDDADRKPGVVGIGSRVTVAWDARKGAHAIAPTISRQATNRARPGMTPARRNVTRQREGVHR